MSLYASGQRQEIIKKGLNEDTGKFPESVPRELGALIQSRIDRLDVGAQKVLLCASVLGRRFAQKMLAFFDHIRENLTKRLFLLQSAQFLQAEATKEDAVWQFLNPLVRDVAYEMLPLSERRSLHGLVGQRIEEIYGDRVQEFTEFLAFHFDKATSADDTTVWKRSPDLAERAIRYLFKAAERQSLLHEPRLALEHYQKAIQRLQTTGLKERKHRVQLARVSAMAGRMCRVLAQYDSATEHLEKAKSLADELGVLTLQIEAEIEQGIVAMFRARYEEAEARLRRARECTQKAGLEMLGLESINGLGMLAFYRGQWNSALECFNELAALAEGLEMPAKQADALNNSGLVLWKKGHLKEARDKFEAAIPLRLKVGDRYTLAATRMNLGILEEQLGRVSEALANYERACHQAHEIGHRQCLAAVYSNLSNLHRRIGHLDQAIGDADKAVEWSRRIGDIRLEGHGLHNRVQAFLKIHEFAEAEKALNESQAIAEALNDVEHETFVELYRIELELRTGGIRADEAASRLESLAPTVAEKAWQNLVIHSKRVWAWVWAVGEEMEGVDRCCSEAIELSRGSENRLEEIETLQTWAELLARFPTQAAYEREQTLRESASKLLKELLGEGS